jgi:hypothetical protein
MGRKKDEMEESRQTEEGVALEILLLFRLFHNFSVPPWCPFPRKKPLG